MKCIPTRIWRIFLVSHSIYVACEEIINTHIDEIKIKFPYYWRMKDLLHKSPVIDPALSINAATKVDASFLLEKRVPDELETVDDLPVSLSYGFDNDLTYILVRMDRGYGIHLVRQSLRAWTTIPRPKLTRHLLLLTSMSSLLPLLLVPPFRKSSTPPLRSQLD